MKEVDVKVVIEEGVQLPEYKFDDDAGMDIRANEEVILYPGDTVRVRTGIAVELPPGYAFEVSPRSGISSKTKLRVALGTVDCRYRGDIGVIIDNISQAGLTQVFPYPVGEEGTQFVELEAHNSDEFDDADEELDEDLNEVDNESSNKAYIQVRGVGDDDPDYHGAYIIRKGDRIAQLKLKEVPKCNWKVVSELSESDRGDGGFGHSGVN